MTTNPGTRLRPFLLLPLMMMLLTAPAAAQEGHDAGHAMEQKAGEHQHVHPEETPVSVGLDERLGDLLPLDLSFSDEEGNKVVLADLVTGPTLILPVYYHCPNVCNFLQAGVAGTLPGVGQKPGEGYRVISISFDETETPDEARKARRTYLGIAGRQFPQPAWRFLTGEAVASRALLDAAGYRYQRRGEDFLHPVAAFVISGEGKIVRYLHGTRPLPKDLTLAFYEAKSGRVGTTIRKVVQFCFNYDAENQTYVLNLMRISATVILLCLGAFAAFLVLGGKKKKEEP